MTGREELLEQIRIMDEMARANVCRANDGMLRGLANGLKALVSKEYARGLSREDVARYYGVSTRTLERWRERYEDFPTPRHWGSKEVSYDADEVIRWKKKHKDDV